MLERKEFEDLKKQIAQALEEGASLEDLGIGVERIVIEEPQVREEEVTQELRPVNFGKILKWTLILGAASLVGYHFGRKSILGVDKPLGEPLVVTEDNRFIEI